MENLVGIPRETFEREVWPHRAWIHHGPVERLRHVLSAPELRDARSLLGATGDARIRVWFHETSGRFRALPVDAEQARALYRGGNVTVVVDDFHHPVIDAWVAGLARELGTPMQGLGCNVYASPRGVGSKFHFDKSEIILVQLRGQKTWWIAPNKLEAPSSEYGAGDAQKPLALLGAPRRALRPARADIERHVLEPGSIMFLPRGYWHESETSGAESFAFTLTFTSMTWASLLARYVENALSAEPSFRGAAALGSEGGKRRFRDLMRVAGEQVGALEVEGCLDAAVGIYSVVPRIRLRIASGVKLVTSPPRLVLGTRSKAGQLALDDATLALWRRIAQQREAFFPADVFPPSIKPLVFGRFLEALLDAGFLVVDPQ